MNTCRVCYKYQLSFFVSIISFSSWVRAHQNRGKLIYETFVKDYVVSSHVVKGKLLFILRTVLKSKTLKKMSKKIYDPRLVWPYSLLLCGPTGCGKTTWIVELLKSHEELCTHTLLGLLNYLKVMKNCVPIRLRNSFGFMVLNNQNFLKL